MVTTVNTVSTVNALWTTATLPSPQKCHGCTIPLAPSTQPALPNHGLFGCPNSSHGGLFRKPTAARKPCPNCPWLVCLQLVVLAFDFHCELFGLQLGFPFFLNLRALGAAVRLRPLLGITGGKQVLPPVPNLGAGSLSMSGEHPCLPSICSFKHSLGNSMKKFEDHIPVSIVLLMVCRIFLGRWESVVHLRGFLYFQKSGSKYGLSHAFSLMIWVQPTAGSEMPVYIRC